MRGAPISTWPNWVDMIVVTVLLRACYSGFGQGLLTETLNLVGAVCVTAFTLNYAGTLAQWLQPWIPFDPTVGAFLVFWAFFVILMLVKRVVIRRIGDVIQWERFHWLIQSAGMAVGCLRGLWWCGVILMALSSTGFEYLAQSVQERSISGPRLLATAHQTIEQVVNHFPGAQARGKRLFPPAKPGSK